MKMRRIYLYYLFGVLGAFGGPINDGDPAPGRSPGPPLSTHDDVEAVLRNNVAGITISRLEGNDGGQVPPPPPLRIVRGSSAYGLRSVRASHLHNTRTQRQSVRRDDDDDYYYGSDEEDVVDYGGKLVCAETESARQRWLSVYLDETDVLVKANNEQRYNRSAVVMGKYQAHAMPKSVNGRDSKQRRAAAGPTFDVTHDVFDTGHGLLMNTVYRGRQSSWSSSSHICI